MQPVLALVNDLMFRSKIDASARSLDVAVGFARSLAEVEAQAAGARLVIVDLDDDAVDPVAAVLAAKAATPTPLVVAFLSHVNVDLAEKARAAGADQVLARSAFVKRLPDLLRG